MEQMEDCTNGIWKYQMRPEINKVIRLSMRIVRPRKEKNLKGETIMMITK